MTEFFNEKCPVCGEPMKEGDDIVVCPDCGAPHHRKCWNENEHCAFSQRHADGYVWRTETQNIISRLSAAEQEQIRREEEDAQRMSELEDNQSDFMHIGMDGIEIEGAGAEEEIEGIKIRDFIMFMGLGAHYYLPVFYRMSKTKSPVSFNLSAGLLAPLNQYYRRMNLFGVLVFLAMVLVSIPNMLLLASQFEGVQQWLTSVNLTDELLYNAQGFLSYISFALTIGLCLFNDRLYFSFVTKKIKAIKEKYTDINEYKQEIIRQGRPSLVRMAANALISVLTMLILIYLFILAVQNGFTPAE